MTILMLQELNADQLEELELPAEGGDNGAEDRRRQDDPWNPKRRPSQPAVRPWWQRHDADPDEPRPAAERLWGRGCGPVR